MPSTTFACLHCGAANTTGSVACIACGSSLKDPRERTTHGAWDRGVSANSGLTGLERLRQVTLGYYDVAVELGRGGMAAVYLAHDLRLDRKVAIKVMLPEITTGEEMVERFRREARTAGNLSHPHIIPIYHVHDEEGMVFFVMKFVEGRSLDSVVHELGPLPIKMVETILSQVAGALAYAHRKGVVHRDIKPANLMLDEDGWAVVTDFGIAKVMDAAMLTSTGATMGTPYYMSPEQCSSKPVTGASDQYSLGVACYELLTGRPPFGGDSLMEVMSGHFFTPPPSIREFRPDCPPALEGIILRMLAKDPVERFAHCDEIVSALKSAPLSHDDPIRSQMIDLARSGAELLARVSVPVSPVPKSRVPAPHRKGSGAAPAVATPGAASPRGRGPLMLLTAMFVLAAAGGTGVFLLKGGALGFIGRSQEDPSTAAVGQALLDAPTLSGNGTVDDPNSGLVGDQVQLADSGAGATPPSDGTGGTANGAVAAVAVIDSAEILARAAQQARDREARDLAARREATRRAAQQESIRVAVADSIATADSVAAAAASEPGSVLVGSRPSGALLYVNGEAGDLLTRMRTIRLPPGQVRVSIAYEGCTPWDSTITVVSRETVRLGYKELTCRTPSTP